MPKKAISIIVLTVLIFARPALAATSGSGATLIVDAGCGDTFLDAGEECDDGNPYDNDGCSSHCKIEYCGDAITNNATEVCDGNTQACNNGVYNGTQLCNAACDGWNACVITESCGDGVINGNEVCDDGNVVDCDGCKSDCTRPDDVCSDGYLECSEECDGSLGVPDGYRCDEYCFLRKITGTSVIFTDMLTNLVIFAPSETASTQSATITWKTNKDAQCRMGWGDTADLSSAISEETERKSGHSMLISNLQANSNYYYSIECKDVWGHKADTGVRSFTTKPEVDRTAPANPGEFKAQQSGTAILLSWKNPPDSDLAGIKIMRSGKYYPKNIQDGTLIYSSKGQKVLDKGVKAGKRYYYTAFAYDDKGNFSSGSLASAIVEAKPAARTSTTKPAARPSTTAKKPVKPEQTAPIRQAAKPAIKPPAKPEEPKTPIKKPPILLPPQTKDKQEKPLATTTPAKIGKVELFVSLESIKLTENEADRTVFSGTELVIKISESDLAAGTDSIILTIAPADEAAQSDLVNYYFQSNDSEKNYSVKILAPSAEGLYLTYYSALDKDGNLISDSEGRLNVVSLGQVSANYGAGAKSPLSGAKITVFSLVNGEIKKWDSAPFMQFNPVYSDKEGRYGFYVPNGKYYLKAEAENFMPLTSTLLKVKNNLINENIELVYLPQANIWIYAYWGILLIVLLLLLARDIRLLRRYYAKKPPLMDGG